GEASGRQEQAFQSLSEYYEGYCRLINQIKAAVLYPVILTCLMLIILVVLLVKVLPVFNKVYEQLGGQMNGIAGGLLQLGVILGKALPVLGILFAVCLAGILFFSINAKAGRYIKLKYKMYFGDQGIGKKIGTARFAAAMSMGMMSGLVVEDAFRLAAVFQNDIPRAKKRYDACIQKLEEGMGLAQAVRETKILDSGYCRMLELGIRSGSGDVVIQEIARRLEEETEQKIQEKVNRIEPTIVITASIMVGIILISVMLPLINIMSSIG
ncbi:MAG: type II secretion system F family protein, partial [Acetivibrio sp.]